MLAVSKAVVDFEACRAAKYSTGLEERGAFGVLALGRIGEFEKES